LNHVIMHINYCEQGQSIEEICQKAAQWGFEGVEFRNIPTDMTFAGTEEYMDVIAANVRKYRLKQTIFSYTAVGISSEIAETRKAAVDNAISFFTLAHKKLDVTVCNALGDIIRNPDKRIPYGPDYTLHGSFVATEAQLKYTADGFRKIGAAVDAYGMKLAFETHMSYIHDTPEAAVKLVKLIDSPAVGINMDYGNTVYFQNQLELDETIALYGDKLFDIHLKNSIGLLSGERIPTALGNGDINHRQYLRLLKAAGYTGPVTLEAPRSGDREPYAREDIAYYKTLCEEVKF
jgi:sugar phosphate isomerase/epimerase